jgi:hypothetical protein
LIVILTAKSVTTASAPVRRMLAALTLGALVLLASSPARAEDEENGGRRAGLGAASMLCTLIYGPVKLLYAGTGTLVSGLAWVLTGGDGDIARPIFVSSVYGDYLVMPDHLTGDRSLEFVGRDDDGASAEPSPPADEGF